MKKISVLGLWHLGSVYSGYLSNYFNVTGFDKNNSVINNLSIGTPPIFEPGLEELIKSNLNKTLQFTSDAQESISGKDYILISLDTPVNSKDQVQMKDFYFLINLVKKYISSKSILIISSQVPVGTCKGIQNDLRKLGKNNSVIYFPENLRLGQAIETFSKPDRIIIGADDKKIREKFIKDFNFFKSVILEMNLESAEISKHAMNAYLATMISFCSEISDICERMGGDVIDVVRALKADARVSQTAPLQPGIGFAGGTLGRDLQTLKMIGKKQEYNPLLIKAVYQVNIDRLPMLLKKIENKVGVLKNKKIGLLGLTYKPGTNTLRRSQSLELANLLSKKGALIKAIDPAINDAIKNYQFIKVTSEMSDFFKDLDAVILMTWWGEFKEIKPKDIASLVNKKIIFDTRNFLDKELWEKSKFEFVTIGR